jgi:hypothetical protein
MPLFISRWAKPFWREKRPPRRCQSSAGLLTWRTTCPQGIPALRFGWLSGSGKRFTSSVTWGSPSGAGAGERINPTNPDIAQGYAQVLLALGDQRRALSARSCLQSDPEILSLV